MAIDQNRLNRLERLARLELQPSERVRVQQDLQEMLAWTEPIQKLAVQSLDPVIQPGDPLTWMRSDGPAAALGTRAVLQNAPAADEDSFLVPRVLDDNS